MTLQSQSASSLLAVGILLAGLGLLGLTVSLPYMRSTALEEAIALSQTSLLQLRSEMAREGELRKENDALAAAGQDKLLLIEGETTGIAGANLQRMMSGLVLEHGGTASSFQILPPQKDGNLTRISMSLSISVGIDGLRDIIHRLETGTPLIFIDDIVISADQDDFRAPDPHFLGPLNAMLKVSGFVLNNGAE